MRILPSVTETLQAWTDFSKIPADVLQHASERGTAIHDLCSRIAKGEFVMPSAEYRPYVDSFNLWFELMVADVLLAEERLYDAAWGYHGQIDLLCKLKTTQIALIDLKSPVTTQKSWRVQLAGYTNLCTVAGFKLDCCGSLQLSPQGKMAKMSWYKDGAGDFNIFVQCLQIHKFFND
jgi:hypothetical protein